MSSDSRGSSARSSARSSPIGSSNDLMEDENDMYIEKARRKSRNTKHQVGGLNLADEESNLRKIQQDASESISDFNNIRNQTQTHGRRIHDMQVQFDEARVRIDKLLSRKSRSRSDFVDSGFSKSKSSDISIGFSKPKTARANVESVSSADSTTRVEIQMAPRVPNPTFAAVSLTVNVNDDEDEA